MKVLLKRASKGDARLIWEMQKTSFAEMLRKYQDTDTSPANEPFEEIEAELDRECSQYYLIIANSETVGAVRVVIMPNGTEKRISPIFVLPEHRDKGIAQGAILAVEDIYGADNWALEAVLQEEKSVHLYEKMGYKYTGKSEKINESLSLGLFVK